MGRVAGADLLVDWSGAQPVVVIRERVTAEWGESLARQLACLLTGVVMPRGTPLAVTISRVRYEYRIPWDREVWERTTALVEVLGRLVGELEAKEPGPD